MHKPLNIHASMRLCMTAGISKVRNGSLAVELDTVLTLSEDTLSTESPLVSASEDYTIQGTGPVDFGDFGVLPSNGTAKHSVQTVSS